MKDGAKELHDAILQKNYSASSRLLKQIMQEEDVHSVSSYFEGLSDDGLHQTLELRDHVLYFLGLWELYFAVQIPSLKLLTLFQKRGYLNDFEIHSIDVVRE